MNRIGSLLLAFLALFALAFAAATLDTTTTANPLVDRSESASGSGGGGGGGSDVRVSPDRGGGGGFDSFLPQLDLADDRLTTPSDERLGLLLLAGCLLAAGSGAVVFLLTGDDETATVERTTGVRPSRTDDRSNPVPQVDHAPTTNEVYRAWNRLVERVDPTDDTLTPCEIAARAHDAGLPDGPVEELTSLFRAVRYGRRQPTDRRERQATDALGRLSETGTDAPTDEEDG